MHTDTWGERENTHTNACMHAHMHHAHTRTHTHTYTHTHLLLSHVHSSDEALWSNKFTEDKTVPARATAEVEDTAALDCLREHKTTPVVPAHSAGHVGRCTCTTTQDDIRTHSVIAQP